jgi:hypothetical protein
MIASALLILRRRVAPIVATAIGPAPSAMEVGPAAVLRILIWHLNAQ